MHDVNGISINTCLQIITSASCMQSISSSYASVMPDWLTQAFFNPELQCRRLNTHQYSENDNVQTMRKMNDLHLVDFVELQLKSKEDFNTAYDIALCAGLGDYAKKFIIFQPGDWPCQFYCSQLINVRRSSSAISNLIKSTVKILKLHQIILHILLHPSLFLIMSKVCLSLVFSVLHSVCDSNDRSSPHILEQ